MNSFPYCSTLALVCFLPMILRLKVRAINPVEPRFLVPVVFFLGYGLEPLLASMNIPIKYPIYFDSVDIYTLRYCTWIMGAFWAGFFIYSALTKIKIREGHTSTAALQKNRADWNKPVQSTNRIPFRISSYINPWFFVVGAVLTLCIYVYAEGGIRNFLQSDHERMGDQWDLYSSANLWRTVAYILSTLLSIASGLAYAECSKGRTYLWIVPTIVALHRFAGHSRGTGIYLALFAFTAYCAGRKIKLRTFLIVGLVVFIGMFIGLVGRQTAQYGVVHALNVLTSNDTWNLLGQSAQDITHAPSRFIGLSSVIARGTPYSTYEGIKNWILLISPMPSFLVAPADMSELNLAEWGARSGSPFPAVGDMHYYLGFWGGCFLGFFMGLFWSWIQSKIFSEKPLAPVERVFFVALYVTSLQGYLWSFNNTSRAGTRFSLYVLLAMALYKLYSFTRPRRGYQFLDSRIGLNYKSPYRQPNS